MQANHRHYGFNIYTVNPQLMRKLQIILIQNNEGVILTLAVRSVLANCSQQSGTSCEVW